MAIRLMLADDHRMLREGLRRSLTDEGFDVIGEASDGDEAVRLADTLRPDVILMDVTMPDVDGVEATRRIHRQPARVVEAGLHGQRRHIAALIHTENLLGGGIQHKQAAVRANRSGNRLLPQFACDCVLGSAVRPQHLNPAVARIGHIQAAAVGCKGRAVRGVELIRCRAADAAGCP